MEELTLAQLARSRIGLVDAADARWDAIVVGAGMGGATFGYALAAAGKRVLFVERGYAAWDGPPRIMGLYAEEGTESASTGLSGPDLERFRRAGRDSRPVLDVSRRRAREFVPFIGEGAGGSSALYGMAMERLFPCDFEPGDRHRAATGTSLPRAWPVRYEDMVPWYEKAEQLFRVKGSADPLRAAFEAPRALPDPPPLSRYGQRLFDRLQGQGLHPYRLPMACEFVAGCSTCQGYLCGRSCKNDAGRVALEPALAWHGARWLGGCEALKVVMDGRRLAGVLCRDASGAEQELRADIVALAAGALRTPGILMRSATSDWPHGLGNHSGHLGRHLMRHAIDLVAIDHGEGDIDNHYKELAFNDFYDHPTLGKLGSVQSFGRLPTVPMLVSSVVDDARYSLGRWAALALEWLAPAAHGTLRRIQAGSTLLALTLEDLPSPDNRVVAADVSTGMVRLEYRLGSYDLARTARLRSAVGSKLTGLRLRWLRQAKNNQRIAHACGTCRFGYDRGSSVLDPNCRLHGVERVLVVDASYFPSSGATNPSLTVAANALRAASLASGHP